MLNDRIKNLEESLQLSQQNERHLKDAVAAANESRLPPKAAAEERLTVQSVTSEEPQTINSPEKVITTTQSLCPPIQTSTQHKVASKPFTTSMTDLKQIAGNKSPPAAAVNGQKRSASPMVISPELQQSEEPRSGMESVEKFPGPPPPTQSHITAANKIRLDKCKNRSCVLICYE